MLRILFKDVCVQVAEGPVRSGDLTTGAASLFAEGFEVLAPALILIPDAALTDLDKPEPLIRENQWTYPCIRIPTAKYFALMMKNQIDPKG